jgi:hypothetical protein
MKGVTRMREVRQLIANLVEHAKKAKQNPELETEYRKVMLDEIAVTEMVCAAKRNKSPLSTRMLLQAMLRQRLPQEVKLLLGGI